MHMMRWSLTAYPIPKKGGTPIFIYQNDREGCRVHHLDGLGHFFVHRRCMKLIWANSQCPSQSPLSYLIT